jgi:hypothetical protein
LSRLRFTIAEAEREATRLATEFVAGLPDTEAARCIGTVPDPFAQKSARTKHPTVWIVTFVFHTPDVVVDGGELSVTVDLETRAVEIRR